MDISSKLDGNKGNFIELAPREAQKGRKKAAKNQKLTKAPILPNFWKPLKLMKYSTPTRKLYISLPEQIFCHFSCFQATISCFMHCFIIGEPKWVSLRSSALCIKRKKTLYRKHSDVSADRILCCAQCTCCGESVQMRTCSCNGECKWPTFPDLAILIQVKAQLWTKT